MASDSLGHRERSRIPLLVLAATAPPLRREFYDWQMAAQTILDAGVRGDLATAHADTFADLGKPGDWLTADEKLAAVRVVRAARENAEQPPWYRPSVDREDFGPLAAAAADAVWRLTNHPGTLTEEWYAETVAALPSPEYYVELMGVAAVTNAMDRLASILELDLLPLPEPEAGEPTRPSLTSEVSSHWVPTELDFSGPNVLKASSVAPAVVEMRTRIGAAQYMDGAGRADLNWSRGTLDRRQIELIAGVTSLHNECFY